ncbi:MAG: SMP-30/gluconolactonase/LRE family protein [Bacteroidota bacterium]
MKKTTLFMCAVLMSIAAGVAQTVSTFTDGTPDDGIAIDTDGNVYASNFTGDSVFKFDTNGNATPFVSGLNTPNGLAFDNDGNLYVCDFSAQTIFKFDSDGNQLDAFAVAGNPSGIIKMPTGDDLVYTIFSNSSIHRLTPDGTMTPISSDSQLNGPVGLAYDENGTLFTGNYNNREIYRIEANGDATYIAQLPTDGGPLPNLGFITYGQGRLWGTTMGSDKIFSVNPNGIDDFTLFAGSSQGSTDGDISVATFNTPNGILFNDAEDTMYITDFGSKNLRIISGVALGVNENNFNRAHVSMAPVPAFDQLEIRISGWASNSVQVQVFDLSGSFLFSSELHPDGPSAQGSIDVSALPQGTYFVRLRDGKDSITRKFVK